MGFSLIHTNLPDYTQVANQFIDEYMPDANGSFVKVYLFLLRHASETELSLDAIADQFSNTEADILRALRYWHKKGILLLEENGGIVSRVELLPLGTTPVHTSTATVTQVETTTVPTIEPQQSTEQPKNVTPMKPRMQEITLPERHEYSPLQAEALCKDAEINSCIHQIESLLGTTVSASHVQYILYWFLDIGFSSDLIVALYRTALSRGQQNIKYIEKIAMDWAQKGIRTVSDAEKEAASFHGIYRTVANTLGIHRTFAPAEQAIIDQWSEYSFSDEIIIEACNRTILQSGDVNLNYTSKILADWHKKGVQTLADIEECDKAFFRQKNSTGKRSKNVKKNGFQNFPQREYSQNDYDNLEKQLLKQ